MLTRFRGFWLFGFLLVVTGCGGGGGGSSRTFPLSTQLRSYQVGDRWEYAVTGKVSVPGSPDVSIQGNLIYSIVQQTIGAQTLLALSSSANLTTSTGGGVTRSQVTVFSQDANRNAAMLAKKVASDPVRLVQNQPAPVIYPGTWSNSTAYTYALIYQDNSTSLDTLSVAGTDTVSTSVGSFEAWRATTTTDDSVYGAANGTEWWSPQLGAPVKLTSVQSEQGVTQTLTATLSSTNVPLQ